MKEKNNVQNNTKVKKGPKMIVLIIIGILLVMLLGLQVFASTNGYGNVFFMIKNLVTTGTLSGTDEIFSDKDITLSYKSIDLGNGVSIQVNRMEVKDNHSRIYISVKSEDAEPLPLVYDVSVEGQRGSQTVGYYPENTDVFSYNDELNLSYSVKDNDIVKIKVSDCDYKELRTLEINMETREITVTGEDEVQKISQIELKKYLGIFSLLNDESGYTESDNLIEISSKIQFIEGTEKGITDDRETINKIVEEFYGKNAKFETTKNAQDKDVKILKDMKVGVYEKQDDRYHLMEHDRYGKCLKIEDIKLEDGIYTVKYIYLIASPYDVDSDNLEELPQYETTIELKRNENAKYSKYQIISLDEGKVINSKVDVNTDETEELYGEDNHTHEYEVVKNPNGDYKATFDGTHTLRCIICGDEKQESHHFDKWMKTADDSAWTLWCYDCQTYVYTEDDDFVENSGYGVYVMGSAVNNSTNVITDNISTNTITNNTNNTNDTSDSNIIYYSENEITDNANWIQFWPEIGMRFKLPKNFEQGKVFSENNKLNVEFSGWIVTKKFNFEQQQYEGYEGVPVKIKFYNEIIKNTNLEDALEYSDERSVKSTDNKGWTDWFPLKNDNEANSPENGYIRRSYGRVKGDQIEKVIFDMQSDSGIDTEHYTFIRNVLESVSSTSM